MALAYKDLRVGAYYKDKATSGVKTLLFVETLSNKCGTVEINLWAIVRKTQGATWSQAGRRSKPESDDTKFDREMTPSEVRNDGLPFAPPDSKNNSPPSAGTSVSPSKNLSPAKSPTLGVKPSKPLAMRKNGQPKAAVENNSTSKVCLCCGEQNKIVALFQFSTYWCPHCEL